MNDMPNLAELQRLLASGRSNITVTTDAVSVTVTPRYQLVDVTIHARGLDEAGRKALQGDLIKAVNEALQTAVLAASRALAALPPPPEIDAIKAALQKEVDQSRC